MQQLPRVSPISKSQHNQVCPMLARAFHHDPLMVFQFPDELKRQRSSTLVFEMILKMAQKYGAVYTTEASEGAAIWTGPGNIKLTYTRALRAGIIPGMVKALFVFGLAGFTRFSQVGDFLEKNHQQLIEGRSHWHLQIVGVEPDLVGQGIGGALIEPILARADRDRLPCYLDTMNEKNLPFYTRYGFKVVAEGKLPKGGPAIWSMLREPGQIYAR